MRWNEVATIHRLDEVRALGDTGFLMFCSFSSPPKRLVSLVSGVEGGILC